MIWGFGGCWRLLAVIWHLDHDLDEVTGLWYTNVLNLCFLSWFERCKEYQGPLCPYLGLRKMLLVPYWGLASWSWYIYGHWLQIDPGFEFRLSILILKVQTTSMSFKSLFGAFENVGGALQGFDILIMIWI